MLCLTTNITNKDATLYCTQSLNNARCMYVTSIKAILWIITGRMVGTLF